MFETIKEEFKHEESLNSTQHYACAENLKAFKCAICDYSTHLKLLFTKHIHHSENGPEAPEGHSCQDCNFNTHALFILMKHKIEKCKKEVTVRYQCGSCPFKSTDEYVIQTHSKSQHLSENIWCSCPHCGHKARSVGAVKKHVLFFHKSDNTKWFKCVHCPYKSNVEENFNRHSKIHTGDLLKCDRCNYVGDKELYFSSHMNAMRWTSDGTWYDCDLCNFRTKSSLGLERHLMSAHGIFQHDGLKCGSCQVQKRLCVHERIKSLHCNKCIFETNFKAQVPRRLSKHFGINMLKCRRCLFQTKYKSSLKKHVLRRHSGPNKDLDTKSADPIPEAADPLRLL